MEFMVFNTEDELLNDPLLLKIPIVRNGKLSSIGYKPETWKEWIAESILIIPFMNSIYSIKINY